MARYLTKSRFKLGCDCPAKLFYTGKRNEYADAMLDDSFMQGLAEGGFQVGELARIRLCDDPDNDTIRALGHDEALAETAARMQARSVTIAEAAFRFENLFIRADVIRKVGSTIELYEVKSKSWSEDSKFWQVKDPDKPDSGWAPYLMDVAFQQYVIERACPGMKVKAFLVLVDKDKVASVDGLNQQFKIKREGSRTQVVPTRIGVDELGDDILAYVPVDADTVKIRQLKFDVDGVARQFSFEGLIRHLSRIYDEGRQEFCGIGSKCKGCEFRYSSDPAERQEQKVAGLRSGLEECWARATGEQFDAGRPTVMEIWNFRRTDALMAEKKYYIDDLDRSDLGDGKLAARQWMQVEKVQKRDAAPWLDRKAFRAEMAQWEFPLHFIDFETSRVAIPFHRGRHPYEQVAFQFSHHTVDKDGRIRHAGQWLEVTPGKFPNFDFVRALKRELEKDNGTIFRYATHENSVLNDIARQLEAGNEADRKELCRWIETVTSRKGSARKETRGTRCMVDMCGLVKDFHYDPYTRGSNSLKYVLPAIINSSRQLKEKYSRPVYGTRDISSLNYKEWRWIDKAYGNDPYRALPPLFVDDEEQAVSEYLQDFAGIAQGGEAMTAYAKLQFMDVPQADRDRLAKGYYNYCELDTFAMVMLYEYWKSELDRG